MPTTSLPPCTSCRCHLAGGRAVRVQPDAIGVPDRLHLQNRRLGRRSDEGHAEPVGVRAALRVLGRRAVHLGQLRHRQHPHLDQSGNRRAGRCRSRTRTTCPSPRSAGRAGDGRAPARDRGSRAHTTRLLHTTPAPCSGFNHADFTTDLTTMVASFRVRRAPAGEQLRWPQGAQGHRSQRDQDSGRHGADSSASSRVCM